MPKLTIDGRQIEAPAGENLILAARRIGVEVPHFCYHEKLSIAANCRMCLVDIEKQPKLQPACQQTVAEGMVVHTKSPKVKEAQAGVMEFLLVNHPLDCPICDKAGECMLQDNYMAHDGHSSRQHEAKTEKPRLEVLGPLINYNAERCIMCTRCVRFMDEVAKDSQLGCFNRGDRTVIGTFEGKPLDNPYSLNVVELCPVGALGSLDFRFHSRVWQLEKTPTVCGGCSRGCNTEAHHKNEILYRLIPRQNDQVNSTWMCDEGRLSYHAHNEGRASEPMLSAKATTMPQAMDAARGLVKGAIADHGAQWSVFLSPMLMNEDAYAWLSTIKTFLPEAKLFVTGHQNGTADAILRRADKNANRTGLLAIAKALGLSLGAFVDGVKSAGKKLIVVGSELPDASLDGVIAKAERSLVLGSHATAAFKQAEIALPAPTHFEVNGTFVNDEGRVQRVRAAHAPLYGSKAHFAYVMDLLAGEAGAPSWPSSDSLFAELSDKSKDFAGLRLVSLGLLGKPLASVQAKAEGVEQSV